VQFDVIKTVRNTVRMYFFLDTPNKTKSAIRIRYYLKAEKKIFVYSTGISIESKNWNKNNRMPIVKAGGAGFELKQITNKLNKYINQLHLIIRDIELEGLKVTRYELKKRLDNYFKNTETKRKTLIDELQYFIKNKEKQAKNSKKSIYKYKNLKNKLITYNPKLKTSDINKEFMIDFIAFLRNDYQLTDISLSRTIGFLKTFLKWCLEMGLNIDNNYKKVTVANREADHIHLTKEKVKILENLELNKTLDKYRDLFLIGIYSGQRFSDYSVFKKADVFNNRIEKRQEKTDQKAYIPISNKLEILLNKWDWRLPKLSNQKFNQNIKTVCELAGFTEDVTKITYLGNKKIESIKPFYNCVGSHTARRTFITLAAESNVPDHIIMNICGIKDIKTLKTYKKFNVELLESFVNSMFD